MESVSRSQSQPGVELMPTADTSEPENSMQGGNLCRQCQALHLHASDFARKSKRKTDAFELGPYSEVTERDCALCRLVVCVIESNEQSRARAAADKNVQCGLVFTVADHFEYHTHLPLTDFYSGWQPNALLVCLSDVSIKSNTQFDCMIIKGPFIERFVSTTERIEFTARRYGAATFDVGLARSWLHCCGEWHNTCEAATMLPGDPAPKIGNFRVIDVAENRLVMLESLVEGSYVTLSYVWGETNTLLTMKAIKDELSEPSALEKVKHRIPKTIRDAMSLTREIGVRYLWVDSLCIVQDDAMEKAALVQEMHQIYHRSFFTIVAAAGDHADYGLPGYQRNARQPQQIEQIESDFYLGILPDYGELLSNSIHSTRAWTMQEACFARRVLIFFDAVVFFQCRRTVWREDFMAEIEGLRCNLLSYNNKMSLQEPPLPRFRGILQQYSSRRLRYDADILNAFAGISQFFSAVTASDMIYGLLPEFLDWCVLWTSQTVLERRSGFPSWSWIGWKGPVWIPRPPQGDKVFDWMNNHTWIKWQIVRLQEEELPLLCFSTICAEFSVEPELYPRQPERYLLDARGERCGVIEIYNPGFPQLRDAATVLVLSGAQPGDTSKISRLAIMNYGHEHMRRGSRNEPSEMWPEIKCSGNEGRTEQGWAASNSYEFDLLWTRQSQRERGEPPLRGMGAKAPTSEDIGLEFSSDTHTFDFYNVMLVFVARVVMGTSGNGRHAQAALIYERAGLGMLHYKALRWVDKSGPKWEPILLR